MTRKRFPLFVALLLAGGSATATQAQSNAAPARLAILAADPSLGAADDMLTAAFSKRQGVILLERPPSVPPFSSHAMGPAPLGLSTVRNADLPRRRDIRLRKNLTRRRPRAGPRVARPALVLAPS